jgi:hypothetical protein
VGDTVVLAADVERRIMAGTAARLLVCGHGDAVVRSLERTPRGERRLGSPKSLFGNA